MKIVGKGETLNTRKVGTNEGGGATSMSRLVGWPFLPVRTISMMCSGRLLRNAPIAVARVRIVRRFPPARVYPKDRSGTANYDLLGLADQWAALQGAEHGASS